MKYLFIPLLCVLASAKVTLQSRFSKTGHRGVGDSIFYNGVMFLTVAILFSPWLIVGGATPQTLVFGVLMGILSVAFQLFYLCAFSRGKMTLTVILNNFSMILPIAVSFFVFHEPFGPWKSVGMVLALVSFCLTVAKEKPREGQSQSKFSGAWLIFTLLVFLTNGLIGINQKLYSSQSEALQAFEFVAVSYITAALLSAVMLSILLWRGKWSPGTLGRSAILSPCLVGILLGVFQVLNTYTASVLPGTVLFPVYNCGTSILLCLVGKLLFRETLTLRQYLGVAVGLAAILCLCL